MLVVGGDGILQVELGWRAGGAMGEGRRRPGQEHREGGGALGRGQVPVQPGLTLQQLQGGGRGAREGVNCPGAI